MTDYQQTPPPDRSVKVPHLVFGLFFAGLAAIWALVAGDVLTVDSLAVLAPVALIAAGVIGLAASLANSRNRRRRTEHLAADRTWTDQTWTDPSAPVDDTPTDTLDHTQEIR